VTASSGERGFTLLEVLISVAISAMLVTAAVTTFRFLNRTQERGVPERARAASARVMLDRLERELSSTILLVKRPFAPRRAHAWLFLGEDRVFGTNDSDALRFVTRKPARPPGSRASASLSLVTYAVDAVGDSDELALYRVETPLPRRLAKQIDLSNAVAVMDDVHSLRIRYLGDAGWRDDWDSTDIALLDKLPHAVELSLRLYEDGVSSQDELDFGSERETGLEHSRTVMLPVEPLTRAQANVIDDSCPGGVTLRGCIVRLRPQIKQVQQELRNGITYLRRLVHDRCWDADPPSQQLEDLKEALRTLLSKDPDEICR